ncbi:hypothetical protein E4U19_004926 [Claviceps sp. Clav32 group G5]|nr:hypothetical protein E4U19_004926 [Claviceps sp. Clav32 group G5]KAG6052250.1 hypothetical protein E4U39_002287 [Claviceps sp. Clav50 group G5]
MHSNLVFPLSSAALSRHGSPRSSSSAPPPSPPPPPRFLSIEGVFNVRDFGGHPAVMGLSSSSSSSSSSPGSAVKTRPGIILRSSHLEHITEEGVQQLRALHVSRIFDLRGAQESGQYRAIAQKYNQKNAGRGDGGHGSDAPSPIAALLPLYSAVPFYAVDEKLSTRLERHARTGGENSESTPEQYLALATSEPGIRGFQTIIRHLLAHPRKPILIHCTLGKDRTGIVFALLLSLAGVPDEAIATEYTLSEQGLEPAGAKMVSVLGTLCPDLALETVTRTVDGLKRCHAKCMLGFLRALRESCGGANGYARDLCGLGEPEIACIREILTVRR